MSHTEIRIEEWEVEICDNCGHEKSMHRDKPERVYDLNGKYLYTASGCMAITGNRRLEGNNPYLRCSCMKFK